jgi:hypothetical protein
MDHTDSATFVIFDRDASLLFNMACADMIEAPGGVSIKPTILFFLIHAYCNTFFL